MKAINFGIDLGTTNSLITKFENGKVIIYKNPIGHKETLASVVAFRPERILVGDKARELLAKDPHNIFANFKRRMGTDERYYVVSLDENVTPIELSTLVIKELTNFVFSGEKVEAALITIPASFDTMQSNATKKAGLAAGFQEVVLLQEPIAASLAYFNQQENANKKDGLWLVYDLGGGTFDLALLQIKEGEMKVIDHEGNNFLGGSDFDFGLIQEIIVPFVERETEITDFEKELRAKNGRYETLFYELTYKCEEAKKELSYIEETAIDFRLNGKEFIVTIHRADFEKTIAASIEKTVEMLNSILERNKLTAYDIEEILLVGGSTFIPYVRKTLAESTGIQINNKIDPTTAVAVGAAYYAANKNYMPKEDSIALGEDVNELLGRISSDSQEEEGTESDFELTTSYSKMSKDEEEVLIVKTEGDWEGKWYRIIRADGGFDTGFVALKSKFTEFLPLLKQSNNDFYLRLFDANQVEIKEKKEIITITHGQYNISGQPIPQDICVEVDDKENKTTKLEVIFEKNAILPQRKTLYREVSKTIKLGSPDSLIINIMEGDRLARPLSNLVIACIEISGRQLTSDLIKGSDIELKITMSDSRELEVEVFLVMTQQEFKNVFSISEKQVNIERLKEQFIDLENEIRNSIKMFSYDAQDVWALQANFFLENLMSKKDALFNLQTDDRTDAKYVIAEELSRIAISYDKLGGDDRLERLRMGYLEGKEYVENHLPMADFKKEELKQKFAALLKSEHQILISKNPSILERATEKLDDLAWDILWNTLSYMISRYEGFKELPADDFKNYAGAQTIMRSADLALSQERHHEFRQHVFSLTHLLKHQDFKAINEDFKGTGLG